MQSILNGVYMYNYGSHNVHTNHLGILLNCRLLFSTSGVGLRFCL